MWLCLVGVPQGSILGLLLMTGNCIYGDFVKAVELEEMRPEVTSEARNPQENVFNYISKIVENFQKIQGCRAQWAV